MKKTLFIIFSALVFMANNAYAHPHVFVDSSVTLNIKDGKLVSISQKWIFGEMFSATVFEDFDCNDDKKFDEDEVEQIKDGAFDNLAEYNYFNHIFNGKEKIITKKAVDFVPTPTTDETVIYNFTIPVSEPVDVYEKEISVGMYDPEFFVDIIYIKENPVKISDDSCSFKIEEDKEHSIYAGTVFPKVIRLECKK